MPLNLMVYFTDTEIDHSLMSFQGAYSVGKINDEERFDVVRHACPGAGACGGMYT
jgi:dihydroxyacid dehydratase/phosphogluconate dehydratase